VDALPDLNLTKILEGFYRRKGIIIAVFLVVFSLATYLAVSLPNVYQSSTVILITPPEIPRSYILSTVAPAYQRIYAITREILTRVGLEKIMKELNLYPVTGSGFREDQVEKFRKEILINIQSQDTFSISFESKIPEKAMQVVSRVAALFIGKSIEMQEQQATGTTSYIKAEADALLRDLEQQETQVNRYRIQHQFELPEQLDANLRTLEQLRRDFQSNIARLSSLQERKASLEKQVVEAETMAPELARSQMSVMGGNENAPQWEQIQSRKRQLDALLMQYSERHPDVIRLKKDIQALEARLPVEKAQTKESTSAVVGSIGSVGNPVRQMLLKHIADVKAEIESLQSANEEVQRQIASYQTRVNNTPLRGIELSKISRSYDTTMRTYYGLLGKGLESKLSENLEKKQKGEQFQIIEPAKLPREPIRPNRPFIVLVGLLAGLAGGFGLAFVLENFDTSFKKSEELDRYINVPVLATIPGVITRGSFLEQRRTNGILALASVGILVAGLFFVRLFGPLFF
jgi:polysaccharide chain length determinant protein (PEP-CTERM system associated)